MFFLKEDVISKFIYIIKNRVLLKENIEYALKTS